MFSIMNLVKGDFLANEQGEVFVWATSKEALFVCDTYNQILAGGEKVLEIRKAVQNSEWRKREQEKFEKGQYTLPDFLKPFSEKNPDHFLHLSKDKKALSYTKDDVRGQQNAQTRISFDGYFEKYHTSFYRTVSFTKLKREWTLFVFGTDGLFFAKTAEEIKRVYTRYANKDGVATSCMRGSFDGYPAHPVTAYAAGDLQVAYMKDDEERTVARSLVWPEKLIYSRVYGEPLIHDLLKARGYRQGAYFTNKNADSFVGAKLKKIPYKGFFLMPYFDEPNLRAEPENDYLILKHASALGKRTNTQNANGTTQTGRELSCPICQEVMDSHDTRLVIDRMGHQSHWCLTCAGKWAFTCAKLGSYADSGLYHYRSEIEKYREDQYRVVMADGQVWCYFAFSRYGFTCDFDKKNYPTEQKMRVKTRKGHVSWAKANFEGNGWVCFLSSQPYSNEYTPAKLKLSSGVTKNIDPELVRRDPNYETKDGVVFTLKERVRHDVSAVSPFDPDSYRHDLKRALRDFGGIYQASSGTSARGTSTTSSLWSLYPQYTHIWPDETWGYLGGVATTSTVVSGNTATRPDNVYVDVAVSAAGRIQD